jgi:hypothetical protein
MKSKNHKERIQLGMNVHDIMMVMGEGNPGMHDAPPTKQERKVIAALLFL